MVNLRYEKYLPDGSPVWNSNIILHRNSVPPDLFDQFMSDVLDDMAGITPKLHGIFHHCPMEYRTPYIKYVLPDSGDPYIYPIEIKNGNVFFLYHSKISIPDKVVADVKNKTAILLFYYPLEFDLYLFSSILDDWLKIYNLPKSHVRVLHGNYNVGKTQSDYFENDPILVFDQVMRDYRNTPILNASDYTPEKIYVTYNKQTLFRPLRLILLSSLLKYDLIKNGIISFGNITQKQLEDENLSYLDGRLNQDDIIELYGMTNKFPDNPDSNSLVNSINYEHMTKCFLSLVSETTDDLFLTEKTFKPIAAGHPFIIVSGQKHLSFLRALGFKTFDNWWSEDYDDQADQWVRIEKITNIIKQLSLKSKNELSAIRAEMQEVLEYNRSLLFSRIKDTVFHNEQPMFEYLESLMELLNS